MNKEIFLYTTSSREKELFEPIDPAAVRLYSCGPTVYGDPHIGNMRAYVFADILKKTLVHIGGYTVDHVMNITDVGHLTDDGDQGEDKMEKGAKRENKTVWEVAKMYEQHFKTYSDNLRINPPRKYTRATEYIIEQIEMVQQLIDKGFTYVIPEDGIYMDTSQVDEYGKLAKLDIAGMQSHHRQEGAQIDSSKKKQITDFALWKFSPKDEQRAMEWIFSGSRSGLLLTDDIRDSLTEDEQTTRGFPGRHIECSAMAHAELGKGKENVRIDIHTGGIDHIPVHHTNEIAQAECSLGIDNRVRFRMHCQFLQIDGSKVSKSKGDDLSIPGIIASGYDPLDLRYFYLTGHYRSFLDFTREALDAARKSRANLIKRIANFITTSGEITVGAGGHELYDNISIALANDLDTVQAIALINTALNHELTLEHIADIYRIDHEVLNLALSEGVQQHLEELKQKKSIVIPQEIRLLADNRMDAKSKKDWVTADALRKSLQDHGWEVKDTSDGYELLPL